MAARPRTTPGDTAGAGRVTLLRTGGGAGPDWGAYALLYTTRPADGGLTEAVIGYCAPDADLLDPAWGLHEQRPYGPAGTARRPLGEYAAAANPPRGRGESPGAYGQRIALFLLRIASASRLVPSPRIADLPWASWALATEQHVVLAPDPDHPGRGWAGHHQVRIGRLLTLQPKQP
ncbi:hypothetical protein PUR71_09120 [Streptomyces sp. SP17BM10]|uniref:hypothetical protein n=1 Tax=Streptomyces sp. SP17BM10 TaxID=3002530 RepID=UPI002E7AAECC|nr:hypothetical protein [Streptomyces sp. SP17BM10]MEE1783076.1 hypothetical protein [Streptomyces sp. SP17BM10]